MTSLEDLFGPPIHTYTRAQAIADGTLVDVSELAREYGFTVPVALTAAAWADVVAWDEGNRAIQDETGRLWDVLTMLRHGIWKAKHEAAPAASRLAFNVVRVPNTRTATTPRAATLHAVSGPGDAGEPVLTVMLPTED
jgi:hypothetical protein